MQPLFKLIHYGTIENLVGILGNSRVLRKLGNFVKALNEVLIIDRETEDIRACRAASSIQFTYLSSNVLSTYPRVLDTKENPTHLRFFKCCLNCKNSLTFFQDKVYNKYLGADRRTDLESEARPHSQHSGKDKYFIYQALYFF